MLNYSVTNKDGAEVYAGDWVKNARGDSVIFAGVKHDEGFGNARVLLLFRFSAPEYLDLVECRASMFSLIVRALCGVRGCTAAGDHATKDHGKERRIGA